MHCGAAHLCSKQLDPQDAGSQLSHSCHSGSLRDSHGRCIASASIHEEFAEYAWAACICKAMAIKQKWHIIKLARCTRQLCFLPCLQIVVFSRSNTNIGFVRAGKVPPSFLRPMLPSSPQTSSPMESVSTAGSFQPLCPCQHSPPAHPR